MKSKSFDIEFGTISFISVEVRSRKRQRIYSSKDHNEEELDSFVDKMDTRIGFIPRLHGGVGETQGFQAIFQSSHCYQGSFHGAIPRLCVNNVVPNNSPVFEVVKKGELARFEEMLRQGEASLRDQDEDGSSLLFVSIALGSFPYCESPN